MPVLDADALIENRVHAIRAFHEQTGVRAAELDVSGGIDSAVLLHLLARALGPENVAALFSGIHSSRDSHDRAMGAMRSAGVRPVVVDLSEEYEAMQAKVLAAMSEAGYPAPGLEAKRASDPSIDGGFRSCLRAPVGRYLNRLAGGIRHGTGNECEDRWLRFYQKGGDGEVDTNPIAMLAKGEVFQLARALGVPRNIQEALPSPDLWASGAEHNDEDELLRISGVAWTYSRVDPDSGEYTRVGSIEALSRFLDLSPEHESLLFSAREPTAEQWERLFEAAQTQAQGLGEEHLRSARRWERLTRHKMNPNCPSLGQRSELIEGGILVDALPRSVA